MSRSTVDRRVQRAMQALMAPREDSIRALAQRLDQVAETDRRLDELARRRAEQVTEVQAAIDAAKAAGWKQRELADAGLTLPRKYSLPAAPAAQPAPTEDS